MRCWISRYTDAKPITVFFSDVSDEIIGVLKEVWSGGRSDGVFFRSWGIST